jgi:hypothetical protein
VSTPASFARTRLGFGAGDAFKPIAAAPSRKFSTKEVNAPIVRQTLKIDIPAWSAGSSANWADGGTRACARRNGRS